MHGLKEAFNKIYTTENCLIKHTIIFVLTGIVSLLSIPINILSAQKNLMPVQYGFLTLSALLSLVITIYMVGYLYSFIHDSYGKEKLDILPEFTLGIFKIGFKALPIALSWIGYGLVLFMLCAISMGLFKQVGTIITVIALLTTLLFFMLQPMLYVNFALDYSTKGLKNIIKPFTYIAEGFGHIFILLLKLLPAIILIGVSNAFCMKFQNVGTYILAAILGYLWFILQMILNYGYARIFENKFVK